MSVFPGNWPSNCPPATAGALNGVFFHLVSASPPSESTGDCTTWFERKNQPCKCGHCALSVFPSLNDALKQYSINKKLFPEVARKRWRFVAKGALAAGHGKCEIIGGQVETHTNWWPYNETTVDERCRLFATVVSPTE